MTASARPSSARAAIRRCSPSPMWCAPSRPDAMCTRRPMWRTCIGPTAWAAPRRGRSGGGSEKPPVRWDQREPQTRSAPSPLVGEGRGGGWCDGALHRHIAGPPPLTPPHKGEGNRSCLRRWLRFSLIFTSIAIVSTLSVGIWWISSLGPAPLGEGLAFSTLVVDRDGKLLRPYATPEGR